MPSGYEKKPDKYDSSLKNMLHWQFEVEKILQTAVLGYVFIYVQIKH